MSNFITTMFVSSPTSLYPSYPAKPEPLRPIFTFAQSQSCMNLRIDLDILECQGWSVVGNETYPGLVRPGEAYRSPLQRIGEALRIPRSGLDTSATTCTSASQPDPPDSPMRATPNYSYKLLPGGGISPKLAETDRRDSIDTGSIISPDTRSPIQIPRNKGYFAGTSLLSFFSNPRTRAPFKPSKANRGTSSWQLKQYAEATLGSGSLRKAVKLPEGEDKDEWLAVNGMKVLMDAERGGTDMRRQSSTSTTRSTCFTAPSPSFARHRAVQK